MEQDKEKTPPSSAGCDTDRCEKTDNSAQKDERNEERKESLFEHEEGQRSIREEQKTADEEISGKVVQKKVPGETMSYLPHEPFYPSPTYSSSGISKHLFEMYDAYLSHRKSDSKQSKPSVASASVPPSSETSSVILQGSNTAEKQKEHMFPIKWNEPGSLSDSVPFSAGFNSHVTGHNTPKIQQLVKEIQQLEHAVLIQQKTLMALRERIRRESERGSSAFSGPSSSAHISSLSESISPFDTTPPNSPHNQSLTNIIGESRQKGAFSVQSQSEPGVHHSFVGGIRSPVTAEQLIREKTAADESKPQSKVSSTSPVTSAEMLRDSLKDSTPGTPVGTECMNLVRVPPKHLVQAPYTLLQSLSSVSPPASQPSFIHKQSGKQRTADEKFSEDEVKVKLLSQSVGSLPHNSSSPPDSSIYDLHGYKNWNKLLINSTLSFPYHHQQQLLIQLLQQLEQQQLEQQLEQQQLLQQLEQQQRLRQQPQQQPQQQLLEQQLRLRRKQLELRLQPRPQKQLKPNSFRPVYNRITERWGVEKRNPGSPSTSVHHDPSISDPVLGNKVPQSKTIIPPVSVISHSRKRVVPHGSSTAEEQKEPTFPIKKTIQRSLSEPSSDAFSRNSSDSPDDILDQLPPALTETGMKNKASSAAGDTTAVSQDNTGEMEHVTSTLQTSTSSDDDSDFSLLTDASSLRSLQPDSESGGDRDVHMEMEALVTAMNLSATNTLPTHSHLLQTPDCFRSRRASSCLPRSHSVSSLSQTRSAENKILRRTKSLPNMLLKSSVVEFTPDITDDGNDEGYRFLCSSPGLYQCSVTGLVFHMDGEGDVVYRIVPWNRRLLAQHHKQPAGPLFDIKCLQQSVCQLHLPHCEIRSTGGCEFLSVAHVHDEGIEFISPHQITDTHVIINITGFSGFGNVKDEDSPPDPVRALVLLFYKPPAAPDVTSVLNVLMLPRNVVLREVQRTRKNSKCEDENYIETPPHCKLHPQQEYTLSTSPEDESVLVQPKEAEFECDNYDNYFSSFQVIIKKLLKHINLFLRDSNKLSVWEREVCLSSTGVKRSRVQGESTERLLEIRSSFIDGISGPVLKSLLDKLFEKTVITDSERESADGIQDKSDKARFVIDTVRKKGEAASSEMIEYLCEVDPFLCEHLGLI